MPRVPAHVGIAENETADSLAKEKNPNKLPFTVTVNNLNSVITSRFKDKTVKFKYQISELPITNRNLTNRLKTRHLRRMKIHKDETRCNVGTALTENCPPTTYFAIPAILQRISDCHQDDLYSDNCLEIVDVVYRIFGLIRK
ncbi:hypothetical protein TNCV_4106621 [Trichonephila clavipes]|nr:hypothetical protein TNCV_4106621 [Trichonephila clavipes]